MRLLDEIRQDLTYALRSLRRELGLAAGIVLTFALVIGANAAMFGIVARLLLVAPPGVREADRVTHVSLVFMTDEGERNAMSTTSYPAFRALAGLERVFAAVAAVHTDTLTIGRGAELREVATIQASGEYFAVLGARPELGRFFTAGDDLLPSGSPVVVLSHAFWQGNFAGEASVLGREIVLDDRPFTIIGVASAGFTGDALSPVDVFIPLSAAFHNRGDSWWSDSRLNLVSIVARLRDGVTAAAVQQPVTAAVAEVMIRDYSERQLTTVELTSLRPGSAARGTPQARTALWLSGVALIVLLIATGNVGTLLLLRAQRRRREIAVRLALGVGRARLTRQLLTESLLLAIAGGAAGTLIANWLGEIIRATLLPNLAASDRFLDQGVLGASVLAALAAGLLAGCAPLLQVGQHDVVSDLKEVADGVRARRAVLRNALVSLQVALCTVLLAGAGLFVRSLQRVQAQDLGFSTARLLFVTLDFRGPLPGPEQDQMHTDAVQRLRTLSGITGATVVQASPFGAFHVPPISVPGLAEPPNVGGQLPMMYGATPEYLRMMGVKLRAGRLFTERDDRGAPLVVLVNETMARAVWPDQSALGKCIRAGHDPEMPPAPVASPTLPCREVVGVVRDSRVRSLRTEGNETRLMQYYVPFEQLPAPPFGDVPQVFGIMVETAGEPERMLGAVQRLIQSSSASPVYAGVRRYRDLLEPQLRTWRLGATLFTAFGALAASIAAVGLFGVVSYLVSQRRREFAIRLALGGTGLGWRVVRDALQMVSAGIAAGLLVAFAAGPFVQSMLFETSARDAAVLFRASIMLLLVTVVAAAVPAWRAAHVSPLAALRVQ